MHERRVLAALLFGNFVIGTGILLPAGMLTVLAHDLEITVPSAGLMMLASGITVALGAPIAAALTTAIDRRLLLTASMLAYAIFHLAAAAAPSFAVLLIVRIFLAVPAAIFTPQAAAAVGSLVPVERRSAAISTIFLGWSLASVAGVPLGGYIGHALGWRASFLIVAALAVVSAVLVAMTVPKNVTSTPLDKAAWRRVLSSKALMTVLLVTVVNGAGQFTLFTYLTHYLNSRLTSDPATITLILAWYGISATFGNLLATRGLRLISPQRSVMLTLLCMAVGISAWGLLSGTLTGVLFATTIWGFGTFATMSIQPARLALNAPHLASASIALNTSSIYLGQAIGSSVGGVLIGIGFLAILPYIGASILVLAALISLCAERWEANLISEAAASRQHVERRKA